MTKRAGRNKRQRKSARAALTTRADINLVRRAVREDWPTTPENQQLAITDLFEMVQYSPDWTDIRSVRLGTAASVAFIEMESNKRHQSK